MSIFVWRLWNIGVDMKCIPSIDHAICVSFRGHKLNGLYGTSWAPGEVKKAKCERIHLMYPREFKLNSLNALFRPFLHVQEESFATLFKPFFHVREASPAVTCTCGIYGLKRDFAPPVCPGLNVLGVAEIWGKIIVAENGYRAQFAQMRALVDTPVTAEMYGVPNLPSIEYAWKEYFS